MQKLGIEDVPSKDQPQTKQVEKLSDADLEYDNLERQIFDEKPVDNPMDELDDNDQDPRNEFKTPEEEEKRVESKTYLGTIENKSENV